MPSRQEKGNGLVEWISRLLPAEHICVPHGKGQIAMIEWAGFVSQPKIMFVLRHGLPHSKCIAIEGDGITRPVLRDDLTGRIDEDDAQWRLEDSHLHGARADKNAVL